MDTLDMAMAAARLKRLPRQWSGSGVWLRAVVYVAKADGSRCWCLAEFDGVSPKITRDFGDPSQPIARVEEIRPYSYLKSLPKFASRRDMIRYLAIAGLEQSEIDEALGNAHAATAATFKAACMIARKEQQSRDAAFERIARLPKRRRRK